MDYYNILNKNIIKILKTTKEGRFYFNQIHEKTKIKSKNNLIKNLNELVKTNILKREENKSNTFYSVNYDNNIAISFLILINQIKLYNLPFERRKAIEEVTKETFPFILVLFGSTAKEDFKKNSDIDLLFVFKNKDKDYKESIKKISSKYGISINSNMISYSEFKKPNEAIKHIIKTGYPLTGERYFYEKYKEI